MSIKKELIKELEVIEKELNERREYFKELLQKLKEEEEFLSKKVAKLLEALKVMIEQKGALDSPAKKSPPGA